jgi:LysR family transcriptional activator of nhaA
VLMQGEDAAVQPRLMQWFDKHGIRPRVAAECDDSALIKAFGREGRGVFAGPAALKQEIARDFGVVALGSTREIVEQFYAISVERKLTHPAVVAVIENARRSLFRTASKTVAARRRRA